MYPDVTELSQKAEKLRDENTSEEEKRQIEYEFQGQIEQAEAKDEQAKQLILDLAKIDPLASIGLAQALQQLTSLTRGKANSKKKLNNHLGIHNFFSLLCLSSHLPLQYLIGCCLCPFSFIPGRIKDLLQ